jgi:Pentapeptide repeats (8 copies)
MANDEHVAILKQGVAAWNGWRAKNPDIRPDLSRADLTGANVSGADLRNANLSGARLIDTDLSTALLSRAVLIGAECSSETDFSGARLVYADFSGLNLNGVRFIEANLNGANLSGAQLIEANFYAADLLRANLTAADLTGASLLAARLMNTDLTRANLTSCRVYGVSAWGLKLCKTKQQDLVITRQDEPTVTVDNIEVAQFIYLLLNNQRIRDAIDTITSKAVLILGRFTDERKAVLDALREELRKRNYLPILFDFEKPRSRDTDETITLLARMARFVVADISDAKSVLQELRAIVPDLPSVPVQPIILAMQPGMFDFYRNFRSFLNVHRYASQEQLIADLGEKVIRPAELKVLDLQGST